MKTKGDSFHLDLLSVSRMSAIDFVLLQLELQTLAFRPAQQPGQGIARLGIQRYAEREKQ